jgi:hypothetical protein
LIRAKGLSAQPDRNDATDSLSLSVQCLRQEKEINSARGFSPGPKAGKGDKTGTAYRDFHPMADDIPSGSVVDRSSWSKKKCGLLSCCQF